MLEEDGFKVYILNPPREHGPEHVHVLKAEAEVIIELETGEHDQAVREVYHMRKSDVRKAFRLVEKHTDALLAAWRRIHG